jgi:hypothetical protein
LDEKPVKRIDLVYLSFETSDELEGRFYCCPSNNCYAVVEGVMKRRRKRLKGFTEGVCNSSDCPLECKLFVDFNFIIMEKKELRFRKGRLVNKRNMIITNQLIEQFANRLISASTTSPGFSQSKIFYYIDQRQEYIVSEASSSSENG